MIPMMNIIAWGNVVPWAEQRQVEQDLIISRARSSTYFQIRSCASSFDSAVARR
jgi:hypothetical protein